MVVTTYIDEGAYLELWIHHFPDATGAGGVVECGAEMTHVLLPEIVI